MGGVVQSLFGFSDGVSFLDWAQNLAVVEWDQMSYAHLPQLTIASCASFLPLALLEE